MSIDYLTDIDLYEHDMIEKRRYLHQHPEVSFHEFKTKEYILSHLTELDHVEIIQPAETSVIAKFSTGKSGPKIGLRADIDALPIQEELPDSGFQSENPGVMHACGHDAHTAMLLTASQWFDDHYDLLVGDIYCIFQHAEELPPGGAQGIVDTGILNDLDFIYGQHVSSNLDVGKLDIKTGAVTANTDEYRLTIHGNGGHSSTPHRFTNPISIAEKIIQAFEAIPSQQIDAKQSAVITNTYVQAGHPVSLNIIPDRAKMGGSVRTFEDEVAEAIEHTMKKIVDSICQYYGATYEFNFIHGAQSVINDPVKSDYVRSVANTLYPDQVLSLPPAMAGEDFAVYSRLVPSTFVWVGARNAEKEMIYPHHHPKFAIDEESLTMGLKMLLTVVLEYKGE